MGADFRQNDINELEAKSYLDKHCTVYDCSDIRKPREEELANFLKLAPNSASGPDSLPYVAWRSAGPLGAATLACALEDLMEGISMGISF